MISLGADVTLEWFDDLGHSTNLAEVKSANKWLHGVLGEVSCSRICG